MIGAARIGFLSAALVIFALSVASAQQGTASAGSSVGSSTSSSGARASGAALSAVPEDFSKLKIAPGFLLNIQAYEEEELSGEFRVDNSGNIAFPLAGSIHVADSTLDEARRLIVDRLISEQILTHPQITINIEQYAPFIVAVMGEVQAPGRVQLLAPHSLLDVLSQVGGETPSAGNVVQVRHLVDGRMTIDGYSYGRTTDGSSIANVMVREGDTVIVPRAGIVYVLGAVTHPGGFLMQEDGKLDVAQAISLAQGPSLPAAVKSIRVIRRNSDGTYVEYPVDYKKISEGKQIPLVLKAQDIVYVPISKSKTVALSGMSIINEAASVTLDVAR